VWVFFVCACVRVVFVGVFFVCDEN
jgi:hypothetical protein